MPAKEIKELRKASKLDEAYEMAKNELSSAPDDIWARRNISWVLIDSIKAGIDLGDHETVKNKLSEIADLNMPADEVMLFENVCWVIGKYLFSLTKNVDWVSLTFSEKNRIISYASALLPLLKGMPLPAPTEGYSFLFKAVHKILKDSNSYISFADWWNFKKFREEDYLKEKMPNGKELMALAEQAYITYAKHLLPQQEPGNEPQFDAKKAKDYLETLDKIAEKHPEYTYVDFYKAKLLLALGEKDNMLSALLPFAKKKKNDFWVWDILADAFDNDIRLKIACYCKALTCKTPQEFLVNVHQKLAAVFIKEQLFAEARNEITQLVKTRQAQSWTIPAIVNSWMGQEWYASAPQNGTNRKLYEQNASIAESILYSDIPEQLAIIEFVNNDKKIANFIVSEIIHGFFKFDRFLNKLEPGDVVLLRFNGGSDNGYYKLNTLEKTENKEFRERFFKIVEGNIKIPTGKNIGFVDKVFIPPSLMSKHKLKDGQSITGKAIKSYNKAKDLWGWKLLEMET
jgi:hypothetical protein